MCGPDLSNKIRGGALAALNPTTARLYQGDFEFYTPGQPGSTSATWARFNNELASAKASNLYMIIHSSGDLTRKASECGLFRRIPFPSVSKGSDSISFELDEPLSLQVGDDGIIGRRVSLCSAKDDILAEGIIGFNFLRPAL